MFVGHLLCVRTCCKRFTALADFVKVTVIPILQITMGKTVWIRQLVKEKKPRKWWHNHGSPGDPHRHSGSFHSHCYWNLSSSCGNNFSLSKQQLCLPRASCNIYRKRAYFVPGPCWSSGYKRKLNTSSCPHSTHAPRTLRVPGFSCT